MPRLETKVVHHLLNRLIQNFQRRSFVLGSLVSCALLLWACDDGGSTPTVTPVPSQKPPYPKQIPTGPTPTVVPAVNGKQLPIVFLHGWRGGIRFKSPSTFGCIHEYEDAARQRAIDNPLPHPKSSDYDNMDSKWGGMGFEYITYTTFLSHPCYTSPYTEAADELSDKIDSILEETKSTQVIIVAHSTGGIVAREYIERDKSLTKVAMLISMGSPYNGAVFSNHWIGTISKPGDLPTDEWALNQHIVENFSTGVKPYTDKSKRNPNVRYHLIGGVLPGDARKFWGRVWDFFGDQVINDDGLIPAASALHLEGAMNYLEPAEGHGSEYGSPYYFGEFTISHHARSEVDRILQDWSDRAKGLTPPTPTVLVPTQVPGVVPPTPKPKCDREEFFDLMQHPELNIDKYTSEAISLYWQECNSIPGLKLNDLILEAAERKLPFFIARANRYQASLTVQSEFPLIGMPGPDEPTLRTGIFEPGDSPSVLLPATRVVTNEEVVYVFAPVTATTRIRLTTAAATTVTIYKSCSRGGAVIASVRVEKPPLSTEPVELFAPPGDDIHFRQRVFDLDRGFTLDPREYRPAPGTIERLAGCP
jgi:pimeloyl-ACP methyl ester carboxylesterase